MSIQIQIGGSALDERACDCLSSEILLATETLANPIQKNVAQRLGISPYRLRKLISVLGIAEAFKRSQRHARSLVEEDSKRLINLLD